MSETPHAESSLPCPDLAQPGLSHPDDGLILAAVVLRLLTELQMRLGVDPDGSHTASRAMAVLGEGLQIAPVVSVWEGEAGHALPAALGRVQATVKRMRPLMSRLARPAGAAG